MLCRWQEQQIHYTVPARDIVHVLVSIAIHLLCQSMLNYQ